MTFVSICVTKWKPIAKILQIKFYVSCISTSVFIAFHLDKDELASDLPLMADCKLIIEPLKEANKNVITRLRLFYIKVKIYTACTLPIMCRWQCFIKVHKLSLMRTNRWKKFGLIFLILPL